MCGRKREKGKAKGQLYSVYTNIKTGVTMYSRAQLLEKYDVVDPSQICVPCVRASPRVKQRQKQKAKPKQNPKARQEDAAEPGTAPVMVVMVLASSIRMRI